RESPQRFSRTTSCPPVAAKLPGESTRWTYNTSIGGRFGKTFEAQGAVQSRHYSRRRNPIVECNQSWLLVCDQFCWSRWSRLSRQAWLHSLLAYDPSKQVRH